MKMQAIINELVEGNILNSNFIEFKELTGGTSSKVGMLYYPDGSKYVIKTNQPDVIKYEAYYLDLYKELNLLSNLIYVNSKAKYLVYTFVPGETNYSKGHKAEYLQQLVTELINKYKPNSVELDFGWADQPVRSWQQFVIELVEEASQTLFTVLSQEDMDLVSKVLRYAYHSTKQYVPYVLHGDCGMHNFIFVEGQLSGIIDPTPVLGDPLYDLIYAFCSSPDDLTLDTLENAVHALVVYPHPELLYEEVLIGLYLRLASCIKHHPHDLDEYMVAFETKSPLNKDPEGCKVYSPFISLDL